MIIKEEDVHYKAVVGPLNYNYFEDIRNEIISVYIPHKENIIKEDPAIFEVTPDKNGGGVTMSDSTFYRLLNMGNDLTTRSLYLPEEFIETYTAEFKDLRKERYKLLSSKYLLKRLTSLDERFSKAKVPEKVGLIAELYSLEDIMLNRDMQFFDLKELDGLLVDNLNQKFFMKKSIIEESINFDNYFMDKDEFFSITRKKIL